MRSLDTAVVGFHFLLRWKICLFYTAANTTLPAVLTLYIVDFMHSRQFFHISNTAIHPHPHLWEGEGYDTECRPTPPSRHPPNNIEGALMGNLPGPLLAIWSTNGTGSKLAKTPGSHWVHQHFNFLTMTIGGHRASPLFVISVVSNRHS